MVPYPSLTITDIFRVRIVHGRHRISPHRLSASSLIRWKNPLKNRHQLPIPHKDPFHIPEYSSQERSEAARQHTSFTGSGEAAGHLAERGRPRHRCRPFLPSLHVGPEQQRMAPPFHLRRQEGRGGGARPGPVHGDIRSDNLQDGFNIDTASRYAQLPIQGSWFRQVRRDQEYRGHPPTSERPTKSGTFTIRSLSKTLYRLSKNT